MGYGYAPLIDALASRYRVDRESALSLPPELHFANHLALAALIQPGDEILLESPAYEPLLATALFLGAKVKRFHRRFENEFRIYVAEIAKRT